MVTITWYQCPYTSKKPVGTVCCTYLFLTSVTRAAHRGGVSWNTSISSWVLVLAWALLKHRPGTVGTVSQKSGSWTSVQGCFIVGITKILLILHIFTVVFFCLIFFYVTLIGWADNIFCSRWRASVSCWWPCAHGIWLAAPFHQPKSQNCPEMNRQEGTNGKPIFCFPLPLWMMCLEMPFSFLAVFLSLFGITNQPSKKQNALRVSGVQILCKMRCCRNNKANVSSWASWVAERLWHAVKWKYKCYAACSVGNCRD